MKKRLLKLCGILLTVVVLSGLFSAPVPVSALSAPSVTLDNFEISHYAAYTIRFDISQQLKAGDSILITFPAGTTVMTGALTGMTIQASDGWVDQTYQSAIFSNMTWLGDASSRQILATLGADDQVGEGAQIRIVTAPEVITNPPDLGDYTLAVATSKETTAVSSNTYSIIEPDIPLLPGIVSLYNPSGILVNTWTGNDAIQLAANAATVAQSVIKIGAGGYTSDTTVPFGGLIFQPANGVLTEQVVVMGTWTINTNDGFYPTTIQGLTLEPQNPGESVIDIQNNGSMTTVSDCTISSIGETGGNLISVSAIDVVIDGCTIDTTAKTIGDASVTDNAIQINATAIIDITNNLIQVDTGDCAINVAGSADVTVEENVVIGNSGTGYNDLVYDAQTYAVLTGNTFDGLQTAIRYNKLGAGGSLIAKSNLIQNSTIPFGTLSTSVPPVSAVDIDSGSTETVILKQNIIEDNNGYGLVFGVSDAVSTDASAVVLAGNEFSGNAWGLRNYDTGQTLDAKLNYWGNVTGPTVISNPEGTGDIIALNSGFENVVYEPWINAPVTGIYVNGAIPFAYSVIDVSTSVGMTYSADTAQMGICLAHYSGNPAPAELPYPALSGGFYDVYSPNAAGTITLQFYNTNINFDTKIFYWDTLQRNWVWCSNQGIAGDQTYAYLTISNLSLPPASGLRGTIFALVNQKTIPAPPVIQTPAIGATGVSVKPLFTWGAVPGSFYYELTIATDSSFSVPVLLDYTDSNSFVVSTQNALEFDTTYYWRVRALLENSTDPETPATAYSVGLFSTEQEQALRGDVNGDGAVNVLDITTIIRIILGFE